MLKSLFPRVDWDKVNILGFDMDGTLYDETEFIAQVYVPISEYISRQSCRDAATVHDSMLRKWLEKGSSYDRLFSDILNAQGITGDQAELANQQCIRIFRNFRPALTLPRRVKAILDYCSERYVLFLVTDGSRPLQSAKFDSLGLGKWFSDENTGLCGAHGPGYEKPSTQIIQKIAALARPGTASGVVYFGDRRVDELFARAAGFTFVRVNSLTSVHEPETAL